MVYEKLLLGTVTNTPSLPSINFSSTPRLPPLSLLLLFPQKPESYQMRKKAIAKKPPRKKIYKPPTKPSTRSHDRTFTPLPSPPTSSPRTVPMARTKNTPRYPASAKSTPPPKATPSKPSSSKPSSSKGKHPTTEEPVPETTKPKPRSVPLRSQRGNPHLPLKSVREPDIDPFAHKSHFMTSHSNYNPHRFKYAMNHDFFEGVIQYLKQQKGPTRSERVVLDDEDDEFVPEKSPTPSTECTSISTGKKSALLNVVKDVVQEFVSQSNHLIAMSKEQRKLASKHENFLRKSRDRVAVFMTFIGNLQKDEDPTTDADEEVDSEGNGSDA
ncbi:anther-specific proline-rich protein APG-like [Arachis ipaensis]|uniref:anther-specific proline-rich protein APG-like n=1 Tax=Arachis ipaensis TaxID=130454 RepID=UPI0007AF53FE|nr:anther-specific proline-rich protein APG-like [Arachis ipaensis]XP_025664568.1 anther-specific proline-rich protein APG-like [Arachis hypogaea]